MLPRQLDCAEYLASGFCAVHISLFATLELHAAHTTVVSPRYSIVHTALRFLHGL
jgi:hypothetical protein